MSCADGEVWWHFTRAIWVNLQATPWDAGLIIHVAQVGREVPLLGPARACSLAAGHVSRTLTPVHITWLAWTGSTSPAGRS